MVSEEPEVIVDGLKVMRDHFGIPAAAIAREMRVQPSLLESLLPLSVAARTENVLEFRRSAVVGRERELTVQNI